MEDDKIIDLYWRRSDRAIPETDRKYGKYCNSIAYGILHSATDSEECINDAYFSVWRAIPPERPKSLKGYLAKVTRNIALNRYDYGKAQKRTTEQRIINDEFFECLPSDDSEIENELILREAINGFLGSLDRFNRVIFLRRYWYSCSIKEIAALMGISESSVKVSLHRTRNSFRKHLEKEGVFL